MPVTNPRLIGPYRSLGELGRGAMSVVHRAQRASGDGQVVALKVLRAELLAGGERQSSIARFIREAEIGMRLDHTNVVRVIDHGEHDDAPWMAMELIEGRDLKDHLPGGNGPVLTRAQAMAVLAGVLAGLDHIHRHGVVHRDIKPGNIVLNTQGAPKITDFGIAREDGSDLTLMGEMLGTPAFIAPELLNGEIATPLSDLFSTGVVAYLLLVGKRPFSGTVAEVMRRILFDQPPRPSTANAELPSDYDHPLLAALEKDPARRPRDALAFARALERAARGELGARGAAFTARTVVEGIPAFAAAARGEPPRGEATAPADAGLWSRDLARALAELANIPLTERALSGILDDLAIAARVQGVARDQIIETLASAANQISSGLIGRAMAVPGATRPPERFDFMLLIRLLARLSGTLTQMGEGRRAAEAVTRAKAVIADAFTAHGVASRAALARDDNPDVARLSADFLRLDVLSMALEELNATDALEATASELAALAKAVLTRVNALIRACVEDNDGFARYGVSIMLTDIEDLIDIVRRAIDGRGHDAALAAFDEDAASPVRDFITLTASFGDLSLRELRANLTAAGMTDAVFAAKLRPVGALYVLATRLPARGLAEPLGRLADTLHRRVNGLVAACADPAGGLSDEARRARLSELHEMAVELGWRELASAALTRLKAV